MQELPGLPDEWFCGLKMNDSTPGDSIFLGGSFLISYELAQKSGFSNQYHSAMDIGPQMCARTA